MRRGAAVGYGVGGSPERRVRGGEGGGNRYPRRSRGIGGGRTRRDDRLRRRTNRGDEGRRWRELGGGKGRRGSRACPRIWVSGSRPGGWVKGPPPRSLLLVAAYVNPTASPLAESSQRRYDRHYSASFPHHVAANSSRRRSHCSRVPEAPSQAATTRVICRRGA